MNSQMTATTKELESLKSSIQYQGRKAARAKSEHRRKEILDAALRIVAREGIRGVKHRAVAKEANVPLASTTYYFKDIEELISDAFMLFAEKNLQLLDLFYGELHRLVTNYDLDEIQRDTEVRDKFVTSLVEMGLGYIKAQVKFRKQDVLAEMAFLLEAVRDERLKPLAREFRSVWYSRLTDFLVLTNTSSPKEDAMLIISAVQGLLYEGIINDGEIDDVKTKSILKRAIHILMQP